jgi:hypothetical protein
MHSNQGAKDRSDLNRSQLIPVMELLRNR